MLCKTMFGEQISGPRKMLVGLTFVKVIPETVIYCSNIHFWGIAFYLKLDKTVKILLNANEQHVL